MVYFRDAAGNYQYVYTTTACPDLTDKPLVILTSPYSASGSELFAAAARDHGFGIAIGQRTFGKGIAQDVYKRQIMVCSSWPETTRRRVSFPASAPAASRGVSPPKGATCTMACPS